MKKRFLVTGGTGFIGSALVRSLVKDGEKIRVLDNDFRGSIKRLENLKGEVEFIKGDIRNSQIVKKACKNIDCVIHLADVNGTEFFYSMPELVLDVGVRGMLNVLDGCIANNVKELVVASSSEVYQNPPTVPTSETVRMIIPDPTNPRYSYAGTKLIKELMAINYGRKYFKRVVIFRPHNVYGPEMGWDHVIPELILKIRKLAKNGENSIGLPIQGTGEETRSFCFIDDFIEGLKLVIAKGEHLGIYHIGSTDEIQIKELVREIGRWLRKEIQILPGKPREGSTPRRCPDITKLKKLGYNPKIGIGEGLARTIIWYIDNARLAPRK